MPYFLISRSVRPGTLLARSFNRVFSTSLNIRAAEPVAAKDNEGKNSELSDEPIRFSTSRAASYDTSSSFVKDVPRVSREEAPMNWAMIISMGMVVVLVYGIFFRDEHEYDERVNKDVYRMFPEMEISDLKMKKKYRAMFGKETIVEDYRMNQLTKKAGHMG